MSMTTKSMLAAAALLGALLLLSGATEERLNIRSPEWNCPVFAWPNSKARVSTTARVLRHRARRCTLPPLPFGRSPSSRSCSHHGASRGNCRRTPRSMFG
jgi:hypothetical protein